MLELNYDSVANAYRDKSVKEMADNFSHFVNGHSTHDVEQLALASMQDHPTLLQRKMDFCISFIELMSQRKGDLRTQASEALARKIIEGTDEADRVLPLI